MPKLKSVKKWIKYLSIFFGVFLLLLVLAVNLAYQKQGTLVQKAVAELNEGFKGEFSLGGSHISLFENFPYVSIDLEDVEVFENKADSTEAIVHIEDVYIGFDFWSIVNGTYEVKKVKLSDGFLKLIQHTDGSLNVAVALSGDSTTAENPISESSNAFNISLEAIELKNIDLLKINEANNILAEAFIEDIKSSFSMSEEHIKAQFESHILFNLVLDGDTSFLHHKHLSLNTGIDYDLNTGLLDLDPSELLIEKASFLMDGTIDVKNDMDLDLEFSGQKPNFDLFLAFVPEEYAPILNRYDNGGTVHFEATVNGPAAFGKVPHVEVDFGCAEAFIENIEVEKGVNDLFFEGHFTTGELNTPETMSLVIEDFTARPETGTFSGEISVKNFATPDVQMQLNSEFNLDFLTDFLSIQNLEDVSGKVALEMNFHDIIDLQDPSKAIERLNESYYTELKVEGLNFTSPDFHLPFKNINIHAAMDGHKAIIDQFTVETGNTDIALSASISDLPAILHHTNLPVDVDLDVKSSMIDILEITQTAEDSIGFNEQIKNLSMGFKFTSSAKAFTESPNLPLGEFFIKNLNAQLTHYPHKLHDFDADIIIDTTDFKIIDFTGMLDQSDFHFNGRLEHYDLWFDDAPKGTTTIDFNLTAALIQLEDIFSYGGENYVPEDYRHESLTDVKIHGVSKIAFDQKLVSTQVDIDKIEARATNHGVRLEQFNGSIYLDSSRLVIDDLGGKLGNTQLTTNLVYQLDSLATEPHKISIKSPRLDFDQLFSYAPPTVNDTSQTVDHEAGFNIFDLPFSNMEFDMDIRHLNYHKFLLDDFVLQGRMQADHFLYVDSMALRAAGGEMQLKGYFNGSNPDSIYFSPNMTLENVDLDKLLFKFDNFGQDQLISDNLHGKLSGNVSGKIHMHPDLVPATDVCELDIDIEVVNGSLNNFTAFQALSDYFTDKNLNQVRFDTLKNTLQLKNGDLTIPKMNLNTSLGYFEISGRQGIDLDMDYVMSIPLKVVAKAGFQKLFGKKNRDTADQIDEIQYRDDNKRTRFITVNVSGTPEDYKVALGKGKRRRNSGQ